MATGGLAAHGTVLRDGLLAEQHYLQLSMLFCSLAAYGGYPCFTHLLMYYRGNGNGIHFGRARALTWTLESMEDAFFGAFACISANALLVREQHIATQLPLAAYRVAYEKHDDTLRVTFIPPHFLPASYLVPLTCPIMTFALATMLSPIPSCTTCLSNPQIPLSIARVSSFKGRMDVNLSRSLSRVFRSTS